MAFADALAEAWGAAAGIFSRISMESALTAAPGICLGPAKDGEPPRFPPFALNRPGIGLFRLSAAEGGWANGLSWTLLSSAYAKNAGASKQSPGVI